MTQSIPIYLLICLSLAATITQSFAQKNNQGPIEVIVSPVKLQEFADKIEALGTTKANETVVITADTAEKIVAIHFEDGQKVKKGELLITLDKSEEEAELRAAEALLAETQYAYERAKSLQTTSALSKATLQERLAALKRNQASVEAIKARIDKRLITAPFDGILGLREVSVGSLVQPGMRITTIDDLSQIKVDFDVASVFLPALKPGIPIEGKVEAFSNHIFKGEVRTVNTQIDPITRTVRIRAVLPNPDNILKPGLLMNITLLKNQRHALLIPEEALVKRGEKNFVYTTAKQEDKLIAKQREIQIGQRQPGVVEVISGLQKGENIISHGIVKINDGKEITIKAIEEDTIPINKLLKEK